MENEVYRDMYLHLMRETEKAINILIDAQRACEEKYLAAEEREKPEEGTDGALF